MIPTPGGLRRGLLFYLVFAATVLPSGAAWKWAGASSTNATIDQVIKGGGLYIAVGTGGLIQTSTDGNGWVVRNSGTTDDLRGVSYGNGVYVAVGANSEILYSPDGTTWSRVAGVGNALPSFGAVTFGGGRFVAVGHSGSSGPIYTSADGKTWTPAIPAATYDLSSVAFGNGMFVAVGNNVVTSADGIHWATNVVIPAFSSVVGFGAGTWVIVATQFSSVTSVYSSKDGVTWTQGSFGQHASIYSVIYDGQRFIAVGQNGIQIAGDTASEFVSQDGATWTPVVFNSTQALTRSTALHSLIQADGRYLAVGAQGTIVYSPDATRWSTIYPYRPSSAKSIAYGNGVFVAVSGNYALTSVDGINWTYVFTGYPQADLRSVVFGNGRFVAVGQYQFMYSTDGVAWSPGVTQGVPMSLTIPYSVVFADGKFVSAGTDVFSSTDGINWQKLGTPPTGWWSHLRYINGTFFAINSSGSLFRSADAVSWTADPAFSGRTVADITYHDGQWIVAENGTVTTDGTETGAFRTSTDGVNWTDANLPSIAEMSRVAWNHGRWVSIGLGNGTDGIVATSADGNNWSIASLPMGFAADFAGTDTVEVAVGDGMARNVFYADTSGAPSTIRNISVRAIATGAPVIMGFGTSSTGKVLLRGIGPTLAQFGVGDAAADVSLVEYGAGETQLAQNSGWGGDPALVAAFHQVGAFDLQSAASKDSALISTAPSGLSTVHAISTGGGVLLQEAYTLDAKTQFTNLSARNEVSGGNDVLILGFNVAGGQDLRLLIRVVGPGLKPFGVPDALVDAQLQLWEGNTLLTTSTAWGGSPAIAGDFGLTGAFSLDPNSKDAAIETTLAPGSYTVVASGATQANGSVLAEVYVLP